jgi:hypothetical protein
MRMQGTSKREDRQVHQMRHIKMNWLLALECFALGAAGALAMFLVICFIPEIEDFFRSQK